MFEPATCAHCGNDYQRNLKHRPSRFCSRRCQGAALYAAKHPERSEPRQCGHCSAPIPTTKRSDAKWCSVSCRTQAGHLRGLPHRRIRNHGLTVDQYEGFLTAQGGTCAIPGCGATESRSGRPLHIDHDHSCCPGHDSCGACVRGLLCDLHNAGLGMFSDDPAALRAAADYLERTDIRKVTAA